MNSQCRLEDFQSQKGRSLGTAFKRKTEAKCIAFKMETDCFTQYMSWQPTVTAVTANNFCTGPFPNSYVVIKLRWIHKPGYKRRITDEQSRSLDQKHVCSQESICCCATSFLIVCRVWDMRGSFKMQEGNPEPGSISRICCSLTSTKICSATESLMLKKACGKMTSR